MSEIDGEHYLIVFKSDGKNYSGIQKRMNPTVARKNSELSAPCRSVIYYLSD